MECKYEMLIKSNVIIIIIYDIYIVDKKILMIKESFCWFNKIFIWNIFNIVYVF